MQLDTKEEKCATEYTGVSNTLIFRVSCLFQISISIFQKNLIVQYNIRILFTYTFWPIWAHNNFLTMAHSVLAHDVLAHKLLTRTLFTLIGIGLDRLKIRASTWAFGSSSVHCYNTNYNTTYCYYCYNGDHSCYYSCNSSRVCKEER